MKKRFITREKLQIPRLNAIALPTIFLLLLFFFMMLTNIREDKVQVGQVNAPQATELSAMGKRAIVTTIYIGKSAGMAKETYRIQLNNKVMNIAGVEAYLKKKKEALNVDDYPLMKVVLNVDKDTPMGIVSDVKQALRRADVLNIVYSARPE
ncbi:biopolymer transporter ExbD [uncultured Bacteroides sp.]|uniref:ExbD/TolR family protein n=1 Tax=uncultured Bacteroides sp. TaxID=162156 RepID=UPI002AA79146|nr:biopolymer transporter ExbD [uncultured Bacteroides sp.]